MTNLARFTIDGTPSEDGSGKRGFDAVADSQYAVTLELNPAAGVLSVTYELPDLNDPSSPQGSDDDSCTWVENGARKIVLTDPNGVVTVNVPDTVEQESYVIRAQVVTAQGSQVFERLLAVRSQASGLRKFVAAESSQYEPSWSTSLNELSAGVGGGGGALHPADSSDVLRWFASPIVGSLIPNVGSGGNANDDLNRTAATNHGGPYSDARKTMVSASADAANGRTSRYESGVSPTQPSIANGFTWSGWFRVQQTLGTGDRIAIKQTTVNVLTPYTFMFDHNGGGAIRGVVNGGGVQTIASTDTNVYVASTPNIWNHIGLTIDAGTTELKLYLNGELHDTQILNSAPDYGVGTGPWCYSSYSGASVGIADFTGLYHDWRVATVERDLDWFRAMFLSGSNYFPN